MVGICATLVWADELRRTNIESHPQSFLSGWRGTFSNALLWNSRRGLNPINLRVIGVHIYLLGWGFRAVHVQMGTLTTRPSEGLTSGPG